MNGKHSSAPESTAEGATNKAPLSTEDVVQLPTARINCPLCEWSYDVPRLDPRIGPDTLASVFGPGIMFQQAINSRAQKTEEELQKHLSTHKLVEWVQKVSSLQWEIDRLKRSFP